MDDDFVMPPLPMENPGIYGDAPYRVAVIHGGPGAAGEMRPVAQALSAGRGVLEPLQTEASIDGHVRELKRIIDEYESPPMTLVGFSWGAWLGCIFAARHPDLARKLILVGSGGFEPDSGPQTLKTRFSRLSSAERAEAEDLLDALKESDGRRRQTAFARLGKLFSRIDAFDPVTDDPDEFAGIDFRVDIHQRVWKEADALRKRGGLLDLMKRIVCPVVAIHGDHDPHPAEDVQKPLAAVLTDFRFYLLENCGHAPWLERHAGPAFFQILSRELDRSEGDRPGILDRISRNN